MHSSRHSARASSSAAKKSAAAHSSSKKSSHAAAIHRFHDESDKVPILGGLTEIEELGGNTMIVDVPRASSRKSSSRSNKSRSSSRSSQGGGNRMDVSPLSQRSSLSSSASRKSATSSKGSSNSRHLSKRAKGLDLYADGTNDNYEWMDSLPGNEEVFSFITGATHPFDYAYDTARTGSKAPSPRTSSRSSSKKSSSKASSTSKYFVVATPKSSRSGVTSLSSRLSHLSGISLGSRASSQKSRRSLPASENVMLISNRLSRSSAGGGGVTPLRTSSRGSLASKSSARSVAFSIPSVTSQSSRRSSQRSKHSQTPANTEVIVVQSSSRKSSRRGAAASASAMPTIIERKESVSRSPSPKHSSKASDETDKWINYDASSFNPPRTVSTKSFKKSSHSSRAQARSRAHARASASAAARSKRS